MVQAFPHCSFENRRRNIDILRIIVKGFSGDSDLSFSKIFRFRDFTRDFREICPLGPFLEILMTTKLVESRQVIYHFKACELENSRIIYIYIWIFYNNHLYSV